MPIYSYQCKKCAKFEEKYRTLENRLKGAMCSKCSGDLQFILDFSKRRGPSYPYVDEYMDHKPVTINSRSHRLSELKKRGLQETGVRPGMKGQWV